MKDFEGRVAVVTGAASGIGAGLARSCAAEGMRVVCVDVDEAAADATARAIRAGGGTARAEVVDVRDPASVSGLADRVFADEGACHLLCNNAGVMVNKSLLELEPNDWEWVLGVNVLGVVNGIRSFVPRMREQGAPGHVVNTASMAGLIAIADLGLGAYTASKHAVVAISEVLAQELAASAIGVSVLCPGGVATRIHESERVRPNELAAEPKSVEGADPERQPDVQSPDEVAQTVLRAVREERLYVITHPGFLPAVQQRHDAIHRAFRAASALEESL